MCHGHTQEVLSGVQARSRAISLFQCEPLSQIAHELGISPNLLSRWCREAKADGGQAFPGPGRPKDEELAQLKRELARVKKERDFLQEAAAFFAKIST